MAAASTSREQELQKLVGTIVASRYRVERVLGAGGMGAVYAGEHLTTGRKVALKFVDREVAESDLAIARFSREVRAMTAIESEHIPGVLDAGTHDDGRPFLVLDLLRGEDLGARISRERRLSVRDTLAITAQILRGLSHAHAAGVIHRDLKPDNVFLVSRPRGMLVKILDFGVSKFQPLTRTTLPLALTQRGVVLGTPFYIAPEQARSDADVDERADLYSVGAIMFECLAGRPPHVGETYEQVILAACTTDAPEIKAIEKSVPDRVNQIVKRALARDRSQRFQTAKDMLAALSEVSSEAQRTVMADSPEAVPSLRPSRPSKPPTSSSSSQLPVIAIGLGAAILGGTLALWTLSHRTPPSKDPTLPAATPTASPAVLPSLQPIPTSEPSIVPAAASSVPIAPKPAASQQRGLDLRRDLP